MRIKIFNSDNFVGVRGYPSDDVLEKAVNDFLTTVSNAKIDVVENKDYYKIIVSYTEEAGYRENAK